MDRYSELRARAVEFVVEWTELGPVLVLAPVREAADEIALQACGAALIGVQRLAFRELVLELCAAELNRRGLAPVGQIVREALAARVTQQALAEGALSYLGPVAAFPGFPRALAATFEELRLNGTTPEALCACGPSGPDLAWLLAAYAEELSERQLADHAIRVELASVALTGESSGQAAVRAVLAIDVEPRTRAERALLTQVLNGARAHLDLRLAPEGAQARTALESLQRHLFAGGAAPARQEDDSVALFSTSGEALECVEIARRIGEAAAGGVPFDQIAIAVRSPERYQPLVVEGLRRAGIPAHCTRGTERPDVAGRSFLALLHCAQERLPASRFAEYLSLGQMPQDEEPPTPAAWERLLVDAAVIGGPERWRARLDGLRSEFYRRYQLEEDEGARERLDRRIVSIEALRDFALPLIERLAALPERATWGDWISTLGELAEATLREPERVVALLDELEPMSEIGPVDLAQVLLTIGPRLSSLAAAPKSTRYGKVWVGGIEEARGMAFRHVYMPGVNEGLFPRPPAEDPLLLEAQRRALGIELRAEDTELLRIAAACASERLTLSFSRLDLLTGRARVPSFYAFAAHRAAGGPEVSVHDFEARARAATDARIGWPAPADPADSIDDAEYDLATLAGVAKGSGEYLKQLPGRSVASLRARWTRWHKSWKAADGLMVEEIGSTALDAYRLTARAWSPSVLQQFARCPYRFALRGIFGLRPAERPDRYPAHGPGGARQSVSRGAVQFAARARGRSFAAAQPGNAGGGAATPRCGSGGRSCPRRGRTRARDSGDLAGGGRIAARRFARLVTAEGAARGRLDTPIPGAQLRHARSARARSAQPQGARHHRGGLPVAGLHRPCGTPRRRHAARGGSQNGTRA